MPPVICAFPSNESPAITDVGGKGFSLLQMSRYMPVPPGIVLTTAFFQPWWDELFYTDEWKAFTLSTERLIAPVAANVKAHAMLLRFSEYQSKQLNDAMTSFASDRLFAVRSSSPEEDLEGTSFAGGYETVLGVTRQNLQAAIRTCFASCLDWRIIAYKREHRMDIYSPKIAVVIQEQIASERSGVAFSLNPLTNDFDEAIINANFGLGESVVQGEITPDAFIVNKVEMQIIRKQLGKKEKAIWLSPDGGTDREDRTHLPNDFCLNDSQVREVTRLVTAVEARSGKPMDIEWAYEKGKLYLLQARPVTAFQPLPPDLVTLPREHRRLYLDLTRSVQGLENPLSEMGASVIRLALSRVTTRLFGRNLVEHIQQAIPYVTGGRIYANLSNVLQLVAPEKLPEALVAMDPLAARTLAGIDLQSYKSTDTSLRALPLLVAKNSPQVMRSLLRARTYPEKYRDELREAIEVYKDQLQVLKRTRTGLRDFAEHAVDLVATLIVTKLGPALLSGLHAKDRIKKLAGQAHAAEVEALTKALPGNITIGMGLDLFAIAEMLPADIKLEDVRAALYDKSTPELQYAWEAFLAKYGHRAPLELDIATKRYREENSFLINQLYSLSKLRGSEKDSEQQYMRAVANREQAYDTLRRIFARKNLMNEIRFDSSYRVMVSLLGFRETPKFCLILALDAIRQRLIESAHTLVGRGRLTNPDDIWELSFEQVCAALEGTAIDLNVAITANRARRARLKLATLPKIFDSRGRIMRPPKVESRNENELTGSAISAGVARGIARVLNRPDEKPLEPGDILVARATDPGWTPLFATASAVVLEVGGMLQHGALVAREYGLPCVSGIDGVTEIIKDGSTIEVDGTNGIVRLL